MPNLFFWHKTSNRRNISPTQLVFLWFGSIVTGGSFLLWLPISHNPGVDISFMEALFTAVSAACVTGLTMVNIAATYDFFGQLVIFLLLEMGGLGVMTFAILGLSFLGRRFSLSYQAATADAFFQNDAARMFKKTFRKIMRITVSIQAIGALLIFLSIIPSHWSENNGFWLALWSAIFHSVSAFCNGGFSIYRHGLDDFLGNIPFLSLLLILITLGGLGHTVLVELIQLRKYIRKHEKKPRWVSLHTRVVLIMSATLLAAGVGGMMLFGTNRADGASSLGQAIFLAVSSRTAGFTSMPLEKLPLTSVLILITLMFIGGSPGSCAGGIKTTSLTIWFARIKANLRHDSNVNLFGYTIAPDLVSKARIVIALSMLWNLAGVFILSAIHPEERLEVLIFEQVSAFATVGLSMNFTQRLETVSCIWIMISMFIGRLGPLTIALWVVPTVKAKINRPIGRIMVG